MFVTDVDLQGRSTLPNEWKNDMKILISLITLVTLLLPSLALAEISAPDPISDEGTETVLLYVNINTDSAEKMADLLNGIGLTKAQAIIDFRDANGPFLAIEDLLQVPGIGAATLDKNRLVLRVAD
jgi:competence protein ComEA|tara:strand:- start:103 stop:480 length:378 start_codon:yes stop_codon:yes gene_type:complete